ncbi:hypothetical protein L9F63_014019, partial [Diploptera punctata]
FPFINCFRNVSASHRHFQMVKHCFNVMPLNFENRFTFPKYFNLSTWKITYSYSMRLIT